MWQHRMGLGLREAGEVEWGIDGPLEWQIEMWHAIILMCSDCTCRVSIGMSPMTWWVVGSVWGWRR